MIIEGDSVSECWIKILKIFVDLKINELSPVIIHINDNGEDLSGNEDLKKDINKFLNTFSFPSIETTASTIFPSSLLGAESSIFERYENTWKYIKKDSKNRRGTYFRRLMAYGENSIAGGGVNQLKHIVETYNGINGARKPVHRRSALIATIFDPTIDHNSQPLLGFPCLQQLCFLPDSKKKTLSMNAVYAMQHLPTRAFGNYLGLMRLGRYMANEMGLKFVHLNCMISVISMGDKMSKTSAKKLVDKYGL